MIIGGVDLDSIIYRASAGRTAQISDVVDFKLIGSDVHDLGGAELGKTMQTSVAEQSRP